MFLGKSLIGCITLSFTISPTGATDFDWGPLEKEYVLFVFGLYVPFIICSAKSCFFFFLFLVAIYTPPILNPIHLK